MSDYLIKILVEAGLKSIYKITGDSFSLVNDGV